MSSETGIKCIEYYHQIVIFRLADTRMSWPKKKKKSHQRKRSDEHNQHKSSQKWTFLILPIHFLQCFWTKASSTYTLTRPWVLTWFCPLLLLSHCLQLHLVPSEELLKSSLVSLKIEKCQHFSSTWGHTEVYGQYQPEYWCACSAY